MSTEKQEIDMLLHSDIKDAKNTAPSDDLMARILTDAAQNIPQAVFKPQIKKKPMWFSKLFKPALGFAVPAVMGLMVGYLGPIDLSITPTEQTDIFELATDIDFLGASYE